MWSSCNIYRALIHRWQVFFSAAPPPHLSSHTTTTPPTLPKSEVSFFNLFFLLLFFCLSPFEFQRKPTTLKYQTGKEKGWWGGFGTVEFSRSPPLCPHHPTVPLHLLRRSLRSGFGLWCFFLFFFFIFTHLLRFRGGKWALIQTSLRHGRWYCCGESAL